MSSGTGASAEFVVRAAHARGAADMDSMSGSNVLQWIQSLPKLPPGSDQRTVQDHLRQFESCASMSKDLLSVSPTAHIEVQKRTGWALLGTLDHGHPVRQNISLFQSAEQIDTRELEKLKAYRAERARTSTADPRDVAILETLDEKIAQAEEGLQRTALTVTYTAIRRRLEDDAEMRNPDRYKALLDLPHVGEAPEAFYRRVLDLSIIPECREAHETPLMALMRHAGQMLKRRTRNQCRDFEDSEISDTDRRHMMTNFSTARKIYDELSQKIADREITGPSAVIDLVTKRTNELGAWDVDISKVPGSALRAADHAHASCPRRPSRSNAGAGAGTRIMLATTVSEAEIAELEANAYGWDADDAEDQNAEVISFLQLIARDEPLVVVRALYPSASAPPPRLDDPVYQQKIKDFLKARGLPEKPRRPCHCGESHYSFECRTNPRPLPSGGNGRSSPRPSKLQGPGRATTAANRPPGRVLPAQAQTLEAAVRRALAEHAAAAAAPPVPPATPAPWADPNAFTIARAMLEQAARSGAAGPTPGRPRSQRGPVADPPGVGPGRGEKKVAFDAVDAALEEIALLLAAAPDPTEVEGADAAAKGPAPTPVPTSFPAELAAGIVDAALEEVALLLAAAPDPTEVEGADAEAKGPEPATELAPTKSVPETAAAEAPADPAAGVGCCLGVGPRQLIELSELLPAQDRLRLACASTVAGYFLHRVDYGAPGTAGAVEKILGRFFKFAEPLMVDARVDAYGFALLALEHAIQWKTVACIGGRAGPHDAHKSAVALADGNPLVPSDSEFTEAVHSLAVLAASVEGESRTVERVPVEPRVAAARVLHLRDLHLCDTWLHWPRLHGAEPGTWRVGRVRPITRTTQLPLHGTTRGGQLPTIVPEELYVLSQLGPRPPLTALCDAAWARTVPGSAGAAELLRYIEGAKAGDRAHLVILFRRLLKKRAGFNDEAVKDMIALVEKWRTDAGSRTPTPLHDLPTTPKPASDTTGAYTAKAVSATIKEAKACLPPRPPVKALSPRDPPAPARPAPVPVPPPAPTAKLVTLHAAATWPPLASRWRRGPPPLRRRPPLSPRLSSLA
eukprot:tig00000828_g4635.t1